MTDQELLEMAVKAAGWKIARWTDDGTALLLEGVQTPFNALHENPHSDCMGDALRLAVRLGLDLLFTPEDVEVQATQHGGEADGEWLNPWACESWTLKQQDPYAATRRAIVRAAAEIGRGAS